jgi:hypothetical protein
MPSPGYVKTLKNKFFIKRNDTLPILEIVVIDRECLGNRVPFNLSGVTACTFSMANDCGDMKIMAKTAQIVSYSGGSISYNWEEGDTDESGIFYGEFQLFFSGGARMSIPQIGSIAIEIGKDINNLT